MMFLYSGIRAEVEPVPGKKGWYQLTGQHIERWTVEVDGTFHDLEAAKIKVNHNAKVMGIHNVDPEIADLDPRFNHQSNADRGYSFGVYTEAGRTYMLLEVNQAEYALFRFLCPHEAGKEYEQDWDPIETYRVEKVNREAPRKTTASKSKAKAKVPA